MNKLIFPNAQSSLLADTAAQMRIIDFDNAQTTGLIKDACHGDPKIASVLADLKPDKDHFLAHFIALGEEERYGYNRNGDAFSKEACEKYAHTFVDHGHYFKEHKNQDPKHKIGDIKAACYNPTMGRIEVMVWGDKKLAEEQFEKAAAGKALNCSMACNVKYDVSSITGKKQASLNEYDKYCKHQLGQYIPEFKKYAFVYNPEPKWFDLSDVSNNADRIAYHLKYEFDNNESLQKAASATKMVTSAELASKFGVRELRIDQTGCKSASSQVILQKLADAENYINLLKAEPGNFAKDEKYHFVKNACQSMFDPSEQLTDAQLARLKQMEPSNMFSLLSKQAAFLPFISFCGLIHDEPVAELATSKIIKHAKHASCGTFDKMIGTPINQIEELFDHSSEFEMNDSEDDDVQDIMDSVADRFSIKAEPMRKRVLSVSVLDPQGVAKEAASTALNQDELDESYRLQLAYGYYKVATIKKINELYGDNFIDSPEALIIVSQHNTLT